MIDLLISFMNLTAETGWLIGDDASLSTKHAFQRNPTTTWYSHVNRTGNSNKSPKQAMRSMLQMECEMYIALWSSLLFVYSCCCDRYYVCCGGAYMNGVFESARFSQIYSIVTICAAPPISWNRSMPGQLAPPSDCGGRNSLRLSNTHVS